MAKRGKVLREPVAGLGLLLAEGRQYQFDSDRIWKSQLPPKSGIVVDVEFDAQGKIAAIIAVSDSRIAQEEEGRTVAGALARFAHSGLAQLIAAAVLALSWFFFTAISIQVPYTGTLELTFWQLLRQLGSSGYGFLAFLAIGAPFTHHLWRARHAELGGLLPLFFMLFSGVLLPRRIDIFVSNGGDALYQQLPTQARALPGALSLGLGSYVFMAISVYFAFLSARRFRDSKLSQNNKVRQLQKSAA